VGALSNDALMLSDVCLSLTSGLSQEQGGPRKTKVGIEVVHVTRDSGTNFKVKRSEVKVTGGGAYCGDFPPTACYACDYYAVDSCI